MAAKAASAQTAPTTEIDPEKTNTDRGLDQIEGFAQKHYLQGWRLHSLTAALCLSVFLVNFEITVVSTSLVSITNDLGGFGRSSWVVTAYLLSYTGFMVILAKLSDILGRKTILMSSLVTFIIFSGACGAAQSIPQLIVLRTFQGLGGSGVYSLVMVVLFEMVPPSKFALYSILITGVFTVSQNTGPLLGGLICNNTTWRWIFLLNVPAGFVALVMLFFTLPNGFPHHNETSVAPKPLNLRKIDFVGGALLLSFLVLVITGFEEASTFSPWVSGSVLGPILASLPVLLALILYERHITLKDGVIEPVLPWRFFQSRIIMSVLGATFLVGALFTTLIITIPLRFQTVNRLSPWQAGVRLLPLCIALPAGTSIFAVISGKRRLAPIYQMIVAPAIQATAIGLLGNLTISKINWAGQFGLQVMVGIGAGIIIAGTVLLVPFVIEERDLAVATAAVVQFRVLGGAVGLAITTAIMNSRVQSSLEDFLPLDTVQRIFTSADVIDTMSGSDRLLVGEAFLDGFNLQMRVLLAFAILQAPVVLGLWKKPQIKIT